MRIIHFELCNKFLGKLYLELTISVLYKLKMSHSSNESYKRISLYNVENQIFNFVVQRVDG